MDGIPFKSSRSTGAETRLLPRQELNVKRFLLSILFRCSYGFGVFGRHGFRGVLAGCHGISMSFVRWVIAQRYDEIGNRAILPQGMQRVVIKLIAGNGLGFCENSVF